MTRLLHGLSSDAWADLVFALLHSLWLGVFCAACLAVALHFAGRNPHLRYASGLAALSGLVLSTFIAWAVVSIDPPASAPAAASSEVVEPNSPGAEARGFSIPAAQTILSSKQETHGAQWIPFVAVLWLAGTAAMLLRLLLQISSARRVRRGASLLKESRLLELIEDLKRRLDLHRVVRLVESAAVNVPSVYGLFVPVILFPASMSTGIPVEQFRAIIAHELAHIRRHDYLINILQQVLEAVLFFNPALWWINRQIRVEREACCDALAVSAIASVETYAETLANAAERATISLYQPQLAFPGDREPSSLVDRMKRLLLPEYRPLVRLPWHSLAGVLVLSALVFLGMWQGSQFAVSIAAEILSPEQRIEKIAALHKEHHPENRIIDGSSKIRVAGRILTFDGAPLPKGIKANLRVDNESHTLMSGLRVKDGRFDQEVRYGRISIAVFAPGYGPALLPALLPEFAPDALTNLQVVLPQGFTARMLLVDPSNRPIAGVHLEGQYEHPAGFLPMKIESTEGGEVAITNCIAAPMKWKATLAGFQYDVREAVRLTPDQPLTWKLERARPVTGRVENRETKAPVEGATVRLLHRAPHFPVGYSRLEDAPVLAITAGDGSFTLDTLPDGAEHVIGVDAFGFSPQFVQRVTSGQTGISVALGPELSIEGEIRGDISLLEEKGEAVIAVANPIQIGDTSHTYIRNVPVEIEGAAARFRIAGLHEGEVTLSAGPVERTFHVTEPLRGVVLDLGQSAGPEKQVPTRQVVAQFETPEGSPPVRGELAVSISSRGLGTNRVVVIANNQARFDAPVDGYVHWEPNGVIGYWTFSRHTRVEAGNDPLVLTAKAIPAGAIYGRVLDADGSDIDRVMISVVEAKASPFKNGAGGLGDLGKRSAQANDGPTRFIVQPLPLGGEYMIVAHRGLQYCASGLISLSAEQPIREIELRFTPGTTVTGLVTDEKGAPLSGIPVEVQYNTPYGHSFGMGDHFLTGRNGLVRFEQFNPDLPGEYEFIVSKAIRFQPLRQSLSMQDDPIKLKLQPGLVVSGTVIDDQTGRPLPGVDVYAVTAQYIADKHPHWLNADAKTDAHGKFIFTRLADREYIIDCRNAQILNSTARDGRIGILDSGRVAKPLILRVKPRE